MPLTALFHASRIPAMHEHLRRFAASFGLENLVPRDHLPNTRRALAISELARDEGKLDAFREHAMLAYWREGRDLERDEVLSAIAEAAGIDAGSAIEAAGDPLFQKRVDANRAEAQSLGVSGIPTFFFERIRVVGCQPYETLAAAARRAG